MMTNSLTSSITLHQFALDLFLGWPSKERRKKQTVKIDIKIQFEKPPQACHSDLLEDTQCYDQLIKIIKNHFRQKQVRLLETLGFQIYTLIKKQFTFKNKVLIRITKKPLIKNLQQGVTFEYGDKKIVW